MSSNLAQFNEDYEQIIRSPVGEARERALSNLMMQMEQKYRIPAVRSVEWERENPAVIAMYRKIAASRSL
ncbi:hypothetical protein [Alicyclobacillus sp. ALC3]|uniref:hypothetical protein n=1 Tax=Alicyclobacillus sp. ALC3 TaxID=2796143 RepID=UPI0023796D4B|nr:hypothetical protein [Alicyclobacillus sp. ALC3]WDL99760.1 hypothetical protein JC200_23595 [Alicyclobacillus sp. ALC3]